MLRNLLITYSGLGEVNLTVSVRISKRFFAIGLKRLLFVSPCNKNPVVSAKILNDFNSKKPVVAEKRRNGVRLVKADFKGDSPVDVKATSGLRDDGTIGIQTIDSTVERPSGIMVPHLRAKPLDDSGCDVRRIADDPVEPPTECCAIVPANAEQAARNTRPCGVPRCALQGLLGNIDSHAQAVCAFG